MTATPSSNGPGDYRPGDNTGTAGPSSRGPGDYRPGDNTGTAGPSSRGPLFTDQYQLVMAQLYVRKGWADRQAQFDYFYRSNPDYGSHQAGFVLTAGLDELLDWMASTRFEADDLDALAALRGSHDQRLFDDEFLSWLSEHGHFGELEVHAVPEGRVVHPNLPIVTVSGPFPSAQLLETALLNHLNYPSLVATKAARVTHSARGGPVLEFGMRRGAGVAVNEGARAALIGGCDATSNVAASVAAGYAPKGTHAHSMVQAYLALGGGELEAFRAFADLYPDDCILLVDTVDTLGSGVPHAITVFGELAERGHRPGGVRLDSGDLAHLAVQAARMLDDAGFADARIVLSGELDELTMWQIQDQMSVEATGLGMDVDALRSRLVYGVGTRLITSAGDAALDGVYKLVGVTDDQGTWKPAIKISENPAKIPIPGPKRAWRLYDDRGLATADLLTLADEEPADLDPPVVHHPYTPGASRRLGHDTLASAEPLHQLVFADGQRRYPRQPVKELAERARADIDRLDAGVRRLVNPHRYHVSLSDPLKRRRDQVVESARSTG